MIYHMNRIVSYPQYPDIILHVSVNGEKSSGRTKRQCGIDLLYQISILKIGHAFFLSN